MRVSFSLDDVISGYLGPPALKSNDNAKDRSDIKRRE